MTGVPKGLKILTLLTVVFIAIAAGLVFLYAPLEAVMGQVQRVFYFHVASTWTGMLGFLVSAVAGGLYLRSRRILWDVVSVAGVEIGIVFTFIGIVSGSIWARPIWNTWWTWDPRLTTTTVMELVYLAYLMLRQGIDEPERRARFGAVYTIVGFISVPLTFLSIRIFRTIHPVIVGGSDPSSSGAFDMTARMLQTFLFSLITFTMLFATLLWHRVRVGQLAGRVAQLKERLEE